MGDLVLFLCRIYLNLNIFLPNAVYDLGTLLQPLGPGVPGLSSAQPRLDRFVPLLCTMPLNPLRNGEVAPLGVTEGSRLCRGRGACRMESDPSAPKGGHLPVPGRI